MKVSSALIAIMMVLSLPFLVGGYLGAETEEEIRIGIGVSVDTATSNATLGNFESGYDRGLPQNTNTFRDFNSIEPFDINGDSKIDLAFGGGDRNPSNTQGLYVYTGNGAGRWTSASSGLPTSDSWGGIAMGDADGDGKIEIYSGNEAWGTYGGSIKGLGAWEYSSGSWSTTGITSPVTSGYVNNVILRNFTGDSGLDLLIASSRLTSNGIKVFYRNGSATNGWTENSNGLVSSGEFTGLAIGDINKDSLPDIAAVSYSNLGVKIFTQNSSGNGWTDRTSSLPSSLKSGIMMGVEIGDCNNDGHADLIIGTRDYGMKMLLGNSGGSSGTSFTWTTPTNGFPSNFGTTGRYSQIRLDDIDKDGDLDLLAPKAGTGLYLFLGNGTDKPGTAFGWTQVTGRNLPTNMTIYGSAFFDMDGDGDLDLGAATWGDGVKVYRTNLTMPTVNDPPKPDAGSDQTVRVGSNVTLNGTGSTDKEDAPAGDPTGTKLTYEWNLTSKPSTSTLTDSSLKPSDKVAKPFFHPDKEGTCVLKLSVKDSKGQWSNLNDEDQVTITVLNAPPVPDAGSNRT
ncbi:MAG: FG-GAP-like repeat-containing protein, partial [Thermoplasmatota archaeon]